MRENNLNLIRLLAAIAVLVSHSFPLALGVGAAEPFADILGYDLGKAAVKVFFAISGYLIFRSFETRTACEFWTARFLRLAPGLAIASLIVAFVIGPAFTTEENYFNELDTWTYMPLTLGVPHLPVGLPGLFESNPYPDVNGPLWTLHYEVTCYIVLFIVGVLGLLKRENYKIFLLAFAVFYISKQGSNYATFSLPFVIGMTLYRYDLRPRLSLAVILGVTAIAARAANVLHLEASVIALSYTFLWLGLSRTSGLRSFNRLGDYSYGIYIYSWPIQQVVMSLDPNTSPFTLMTYALSLALPLAVLSWHLVEAPALKLRRVPIYEGTSHQPNTTVIPAGATP